MARIPNFGGSRPVSTEDFNERVKRIFEAKAASKQDTVRAPASPRRKSLPFK